MNARSLGVDIAKATFTAALWEAGRGRELGTFPNTPAGFAALEQAVQPADAAAPVHLTLEPTGGYELALLRSRINKEWALVRGVSPPPII